MIKEGREKWNKGAKSSKGRKVERSITEGERKEGI